MSQEHADRSQFQKSSAMRYAYLGPEGTFADAALQDFLNRQDNAAGFELFPQPDVVSAIDAVRGGLVDVALVPMENSIEGGVTATLDSLSEGQHLCIVGEVVIPVSFVLAVRPDFEGGLADIDSVGTHTHAQAQCRNWLSRTLPRALNMVASSTAAAAESLANGTANYEASISARIAAERYGLKIIAERIEDNPNGRTRFIALGRNGRSTEPTGADRTTLVVFLPDNQPGALVGMLEQFVARGVNLSRIESRPIRESFGNYSFSIDVEGHIEEQRMQEILKGLHRTCPNVRFLGSYPRADGVVTTIRPGTSDQDFAAATNWVNSLREM